MFIKSFQKYCLTNLHMAHQAHFFSQIINFVSNSDSIRIFNIFFGTGVVLEVSICFEYHSKVGYTLVTIMCCYCYIIIIVVMVQCYHSSYLDLMPTLISLEKKRKMKIFYDNPQFDHLTTLG